MLIIYISYKFIFNIRDHLQDYAITFKCPDILSNIVKKLEPSNILTFVHPTPRYNQNSHS